MDFLKAQEIYLSGIFTYFKQTEVLLKLKMLAHCPGTGQIVQAMFHEREMLTDLVKRQKSSGI